MSTTAFPADLQEWLSRKAEENRQLYEQYGRPLEVAHRGEYVAIDRGGRVILGRRAGEVLQQAIQAFGSGNFALKRVGHTTFGRWLTVGR